jgi:hypothetical protein
MLNFNDPKPINDLSAKFAPVKTFLSIVQNQYF